MLAVSTLLEKYATAPFVVLSDFDGTISTEDSNDAVIDAFGMGAVARRALWSKVVTGEDGANFRDCFRTSLESVRPNLTFDEVVAFLRKGASSLLGSSLG
jgi:2-hydroxy-3-keto-5-methylthiopentenyl-1-phosphate phosphatase